MTREEAIETLNEIKSLLTFLFTMFDEKEKRERRKEALEMAIQALNSLEEVYANGYNDGFTQAEVNYENDKALSQEPCTDTVSIRKDILKCRVGNIVAYNVEWLKKHWQMEMDIACGVKPCADAVSREAVNILVDELARAISDERCHIPQRGRDTGHIMHDILDLPSVNPQPCDDAISREDAIEAFADMRDGYPKFHGDMISDYMVAKILKELPSVTQKPGKWINDKNDMPICSQCGYIPQYDRAIDDYEYSNFCPNCGARMESEDKE